MGCGPVGSSFQRSIQPVAKTLCLHKLEKEISVVDPNKRTKGGTSMMDAVKL